MQNKKLRKSLSIILLICMLFTIMPVSAFADPGVTATAVNRWVGTDALIIEHDAILDASGAPTGKYTEVKNDTEREINVKYNSANKELSHESLTRIKDNVNGANAKTDRSLVKVDEKVTFLASGHTVVNVYNKKNVYPVKVNYIDQNKKVVDTLAMQVPADVKKLDGNKGYTDAVKKNVPAAYSLNQTKEYAINWNKDKTAGTVNVNVLSKEATVYAYVYTLNADTQGNLTGKKTANKQVRLSVNRKDFKTNEEGKLAGTLTEKHLKDILAQVNNGGNAEYDYATGNTKQVEGSMISLNVVMKTRPVAVKYVDEEKNVLNKDSAVVLQVPIHVNDLEKATAFKQTIKDNVPATYELAKKQNYKIDDTNSSVTVKVNKQMQEISIQYLYNEQPLQPQGKMVVPVDQTTVTKAEVAKYLPENYVLPVTPETYAISNKVVKVAVTPVMRNVTVNFKEVDNTGKVISEKPIAKTASVNIPTWKTTVADYADEIAAQLPKAARGQHQYKLYTDSLSKNKIVVNGKTQGTVDVYVVKTTKTINVYFHDVETPKEDLINVKAPVQYVIPQGQRELDKNDVALVCKNNATLNGYVFAGKGAFAVSKDNTVVLPVQKVYGKVTVVYKHKKAAIATDKPVAFDKVWINETKLNEADKKAAVAGKPYGYEVVQKQEFKINWNKAKTAGVVTVAVVPHFQEVDFVAEPEQAVTTPAVVTKKVALDKDDKLIVPNANDLYKVKDGYVLKTVTAIGFDKTTAAVGDTLKPDAKSKTHSIRYIFAVKEAPKPASVKVSVSATPDKAIDGADVKNDVVLTVKDGKVTVPEQNYFKVNDGYVLDSVVATGFSKEPVTVKVGDTLAPVALDKLSLEYRYVVAGELVTLTATPDKAVTKAVRNENLALDKNGYITVPADSRYFTANKGWTLKEINATGFDGRKYAFAVEAGEKLKVSAKDPVLEYVYEEDVKTAAVNIIAGPAEAVEGSSAFARDLALDKDGMITVPKSTDLYKVKAGYVLKEITATGFDNKSVFTVVPGQKLLATSAHPVLRYVFEKAATNEVVMTIGSSQILVNGKASYIDAAPVIKDNRTFVPFRALAEAFGAEVTYIDANRTIIAKMDGTTVIMVVGSTTYTVNGEKHTMDVAPYIASSNRTMVPIRFVAEAFGIQVTPTYNPDHTTASVIFTK